MQTLKSMVLLVAVLSSAAPVEARSLRALRPAECTPQPTATCLDTGSAAYRNEICGRMRAAYNSGAQQCAIGRGFQIAPVKRVGSAAVGKGPAVCDSKAEFLLCAQRRAQQAADVGTD